MILSEVIKELQEIYNKEGDMEVQLWMTASKESVSFLFLKNMEK